MRRAATVLLAAAACCAAAVGCGGEDSAPERTTVPRTAPAEREVTIAAPRDGRRIKARETAGGAWTARVKVTGTTDPNGTVHLRAGCRPKPCLEQATAGEDGGWSATLRLRTRPSVRFVPIDAAPDDEFAIGSAVVTVELYGPRTVLADAGPSKPKSNRARQEPSRALPREVLVVGDSLAMGFGGPLKAELRGWKVEVDAAESRPLATGMRILEERSRAPAILAFSLFTNDDPRRAGELETAVRATATRSGGCAVWATIVRPPFNGRRYDDVNRRLRALARQEQLALGLQIVDWAAAVARRPSLVSGDGVHATPQGYRTMARMYAEAIRACAGEEP